MSSEHTHTVGVPGEYFLKMAKADYQNYKRALAREFLQNSTDAGATRIEFNFGTHEDTLTVRDNGCGMDQDILVNKLLVLGGSHKHEDSVGGFGKAKELLFFSWDRYQIQTRNLLVEGSGAHYSIKESSTPIQGTEVTIWFKNESVYDFLHYFEEELACSQPKPGTEVFLNGKEVEPLRRGRLAREMDYRGKPFAKVYFNKSNKDTRMYIRLRGIHMFGRTLNDLKSGQIVVELQGESVDLLTSNRDGMNYWAQDELNKLVDELTIDCKSALREKPLKVERYTGEGLIEEFSSSSSYSKKMQSLADTTDRVLEHVMDLEDIKMLLNGQTLTMLQSKSKEILKIGETKGIEAAKNEIKYAMRALNYRPDFIVKRNQKLPKHLDPKTWSEHNLKIALMWETAIRHVLIATKKETPFAIGWVTHDPEVMAELHPLNDGGVAFLLNPLNTNLCKKNFDYVVQELVDLAVHEVTHLDHRYHNEAFIVGEFVLRRACRPVNFAAIMKQTIDLVDKS